MPYGDRQPRLIGQRCSKDKCAVTDFVDPSALKEMHKQHGVIVTTSHQAGYINDHHNFWNIKLVTEENLKDDIDYNMLNDDSI